MGSKKEGYGLKWIFSKNKGSRFLLLVYTITIIFNTVISLSVAYFLKLFVDVATRVIDESLLKIGLIAFAVIGVGGIITMLNSVLAQIISGRTERNLRVELMNVIFSRQMADISKLHTGELLTKLTVDIQAVSNCFINIIKSMVGGIASALIATVALFFLNWKMAIIMLVLTPLLMLVMGIFTPFMKKASETDIHNDEANRSLMQENLSRIMLIKTYFMSNKTIAKVKSKYADKLKSGIRLGMWGGILSFIGTLIANAMFMVALGVGAYFVMTGETTLGSIIAIVQLLNYIVNPVANFAGSLASISQATASSGRIGILYELPADKETAAADPVEAIELTVENVSFTYNEAVENENEINVLDNVNVSFHKGFVTGLVGKSGSGKSTLLKLLIGLYTPKSGKIILKHDSGFLSGAEIMPQVAYVPPVDYLFSGTVEENIIMSENETRFDDMVKAAGSANILDFIQALENGFGTVIGEHGGTVSSGQAQRIAIARAIYKQSSIIIFDEPTANLDTESIEKFQEAVKGIAKDKICIIVTHDLSTMSICDKVYILEHSCLREKQADEELFIDAESSLA